jgi:hypothetical protein
MNKWSSVRNRQEGKKGDIERMNMKKELRKSEGRMMKQRKN